MNSITKAIIEMKDEWIAKKIVRNAKEINKGPCVKFSEEVTSKIQEEFQLLNNHDFILNEEGWYYIEEEIFWNKKELLKYGAILPKDIKVSDLGGKILRFHQWIYFEGKHYDAECPKGVENMFDLPFFKYYLKEKKKKKLYHLFLVFFGNKLKIKRTKKTNGFG